MGILCYGQILWAIFFQLGSSSPPSSERQGKSRLVALHLYYLNATSQTELEMKI